MHVTQDYKSMTDRPETWNPRGKLKAGARLRATAFVKPDMQINPLETPARPPRPGEPGGSFRPAESLYAERNERNWATIMLSFLILLTVIGAMLWLLG